MLSCKSLNLEIGNFEIWDWWVLENVVENFCNNILNLKM